MRASSGTEPARLALDAAYMASTEWLAPTGEGSGAVEGILLAFLDAFDDAYVGDMAIEGSASYIADLIREDGNAR